MNEQSFGKRLRTARERAGFESYRLFVAYLREQNQYYAPETIGNWERDERKPAREALITVLSHLAKAGGLAGAVQVQAMLEAGEYDRLRREELRTYFPDLPDDIVIPNLPAKPYNQLIGRADLVGLVSTSLLDPHAPRLVVISGLGGIGKTALAHEVVDHDVSATVTPQ